MSERSSSPEIFAGLEGVGPESNIKVPGEAKLDFGGLLDEPLKIYENLAKGCGGQVWPAGEVLAKHMLRYHRQKLQHARILELGAGGGLVGLAVAKAAVPKHVLHITDQEEMFALMKQNIALNGLQTQVEASILNWGGPLPTDIVTLKPDVILAADCVYFEPAFPLLLKTLTNLLDLCPSAIVYFCFKRRRRADMHFLRKAKKSFEVTELEDEDREVFGRQRLFLLSFERKSGAAGVKKEPDQ